MRLLRSIVGIIALASLPSYAAAQTATTGAIGGVAKDTSGAVLPGVTVEASSPALIEKTRTVVTDADGNYKIVDLPVGTYAVTFSLTGFSTVKREGIVLTSGFTANVSGDLKVGSIAETITVTGSTPVVDVQNAKTQQVLSRDLLDASPSALQNTYSFAAMTVGLNVTGSTGHDVGGSVGEVGGAPGYHGISGTDSKYKIDGMDYNNFSGNGGGSQRVYHPNQLAVSENNLGLGGQGAETETAGVQMNLVPREGGNRFSGTVLGVSSGSALMQNNLTDDLKARGLVNPGGINSFWDYGMALGGPVAADKLWFFVAPHVWGQHNQQPGGFYNASQHTPFYTPASGSPAVEGLWNQDYAGRMTWQVSATNKVTVSNNFQKECLCVFVANAAVAPEYYISYKPNINVTQATWTHPATNKLLFQAGMSIMNIHNHSLPTGDVQPTDISTIDAGTGVLYGSPAGGISSISNNLLLEYGGGNHEVPLYTRFSTSYVTGSHAIKAGLTELEGWRTDTDVINQGLSYIFLNRRPISLTEYATPFQDNLRVRSLGLYAQDQWTLNRLTINYGLRYDYFTGSVGPETLPAGAFLPQRSFGEVDSVPSFKDINPRLGAAYDLFGNGKTAIKASWGRYVGSLGAGIAQSNNPALRAVFSTSRSWTDANGNYVPDCTLSNPAANGECGAIANSLFGTVVPGTSYADNAIHGWGNRPYTYQTSVSLQQELVAGLSATVGYFHTSYGNILAAVNTSVSGSDFSSYCVTAPTDPHLPGGGGYQVCGVQDVSPAKFGQVTTLVEQSKDLGFGDITRSFNGVDVTLNGRFHNGALVTGGVAVGRSVQDDCAFNTHPNVYATGAAFILDGADTVGGAALPAGSPVPHPLSSAYCHVTTPWSQSTQLKATAVYPLPYAFEVSGVFQNIPGLVQADTVTYTNAVVAPALGRNLSSGPAGSVAVPVIVPNSAFEDRLTQLDLRVAKLFKFGSTARLRINADLYNVFNASDVSRLNGAGAAWYNATQIMLGRYAKFGAQYDF
jgi:hypothetical protein